MARHVGRQRACMQSSIHDTDADEPITMQPWRLDELNYGQVKANPPYEVAVLPLGATEPHNLHLPYGTDTFQVEVIAARACAIAIKQGARVLQLPALPYGTETNQMKFPLAMNLNPTTLLRVITDLVDSLATHGISRCVLLNGHGGNDLKWVLRELHCQTPVHLFLCNWYKVAADVYATIFEQKDDHAGEMETSMGLAHFPSWSRSTRPTRGRPAEPVRGGQSRLGRDHPPLAPADDQLGLRRSAGRHGRQGGSAHQPGRRANRPVPHRAGLEPARRYFPVLTVFETVM